MLRFRVLIAQLLVVALSGASPLLAAGAGPVSGHALDAGGQPLANLTVELLEAFEGRPSGGPVRTYLTDERGAWSFRSIPSGEYLVRMVHGDQSIGVPVSVTGASGATGVLVIAPSLSLEQAQAAAGAAAAAGGGGAAGILASALMIGAIAAGITVVEIEHQNIKQDRS